MSKTNKVVFIEYCRGISKFLLIFCVTFLIYAISNAQDNKIPANATMDPTGRSWVCNPGYQQEGLTCVPVIVPPNASLDATGHNWMCNKGYERQGTRCIPLQVTKKATFDAVDRKLECQRGYQLQGPVCVPIILPVNAVLDATGNRWECQKGFRQVQESCIAMTPAELEYQREFEATVKELEQISKARQQASDVSCATEETTKTKVCVKRNTGQIHCEKNASGNFYNTCNVTLEYQIVSMVSGKVSLNADIECVTKIKYTKIDSTVLISNPEKSSKSHVVNETKRTYDKMDVKFVLNPDDKVQKVDIESAECAVKALRVQ